MTAKMISYKMLQDSAIAQCVNEIKKGNLVAFPTETVFGLGANLFDDKAIEKIFLAKGRPTSDPLIVHVGESSQVDALTIMTAFQKRCFQALSAAFWPGPLTMIVKASSLVPKLVTANQDWVGVRMPRHPVALSLLRAAGVPLPAPSANVFGHVSPTSAQHVFDDLGFYDDLTILDSDVACDVGIESSVVKICEDDEVQILRPGAIHQADIQRVLSEQEIRAVCRAVSKVKKTGAMESPGQFLTHYAPQKESFLLLPQNQQRNTDVFSVSEDLFSSTALLDFAGQNVSYREKMLHYLDLSQSGDLEEAKRNLFSFLRLAENKDGVQRILLPYLLNQHVQTDDICDRIYRAVSGRYAQLSSL